MDTYRFAQTGYEIQVEQLKSELKKCEISLKCEDELVRWNHSTLGIVFDTINMYRKHCGYEIKMCQLDIFRPIELCK